MTRKPPCSACPATVCGALLARPHITRSSAEQPGHLPGAFCEACDNVRNLRNTCEHVPGRIADAHVPAACERVTSDAGGACRGACETCAPGHEVPRQREPLWSAGWRLSSIWQRPGGMRSPFQPSRSFRLEASWRWDDHWSRFGFDALTLPELLRSITAFVAESICDGRFPAPRWPSAAELRAAQRHDSFYSSTISSWGRNGGWSGILHIFRLIAIAPV
jgi:hypothetical protein